jgi:hypothetical protein
MQPFIPLPLRTESLHEPPVPMHPRPRDTLRDARTPDPALWAAARASSRTVTATVRAPRTVHSHQGT